MTKGHEPIRPGVVRRGNKIAEEPIALPVTVEPTVQSGVDVQPPTIDPVLVTNFTHQIINPLGGIVGTIDNMIDGTTPAAKIPQRLKAVRGQLETAIELVRNLAYLSSMSTEVGLKALQEQAIDVTLPRIIIEASQFFQDIAEQRKIQVQLIDRETQYVVRGHPDMLRQVFVNVIENAVKYSDADTVVEIAPRGQRGGSLLVEVRNHGPGFEAHERERLFDLGFRGEAAQSLKASGSGLGLHICRQILTPFGASIWAECRREKRLVQFFIKFPYYSTSADPHHGQR
jgi:signal transduction histidine kinase